jgi:hypothetical protein
VVQYELEEEDWRELLTEFYNEDRCPSEYESHSGGLAVSQATGYLGEAYA